MRQAAVRILHAEPAATAGPLERWLASARRRNAERQLAGFRAVGAADSSVAVSLADDTPFGPRLRSLVADLESGAARRGLVVLGSGAIPLAIAADRAAFVQVAASGEARALANNRYSADIVAVGRPEVLLRVPDLPGDNALPRWLEEGAGQEVADLGRRWRLAMDLDSPLDILLVGRGRASGPSGVEGTPPPIDLGAVRECLAAIASVARDRRAELLVAGRTSAVTLRWLERSTAARTRAIVEERGLRAATPAASGQPPGAGTASSTRRAPSPQRVPRADRPPRSVLGLVLDREGPAALGRVVAELADGAVLDTRVLLAHRLGSDEARWPAPEDRFASDLLRPDLVADPWLRELTAAACAASVPILLGGHSLVGPGLRLVLGRGAAR